LFGKFLFLPKVEVAALTFLKKRVKSKKGTKVKEGENCGVHASS
jgi:hypothetical protein